ncbi:MAG TPA: SDR family NAD(P)-dependent oxidoreductase, partial [bacterium]|nr:SDR family NAD(P)-dependent oxidoreductase [bacterium]
NRFEAQGRGCLAVISSVAGDRGRQSNYVYGTAKATVTAFLSGLRNRLFRSGVQVLTIKPGMVDTPMTAALKKGPLFASADTVAAGIVRAVDKRRDVVYVPGYWRLVMGVIKALPEGVFKRLKL